MVLGLQAVNWLNSKYQRPLLTDEDVWAGFESPDKGLVELLQNQNYSSDLKAILERVSISKVGVVSFNVFGTLLLRPYAKPRDLLIHLGQIHNLPDFGEKRIDAEKRARAKVKHGEVTLEEIYRELEAPYSSLMDEELKLERQTLQVNPEMLIAFNYAKSLNKTIVLMADSYLSSKFIEGVLKDKGITGFRKIFTTSEYRMQKEDGSLFVAALRELKMTGNGSLFVDLTRYDAKP